MKAAIFQGPGLIGIGDRPDPRVEGPTDAVVRVVMACVCGSDLWYYRGESEHAVGSIGHEFIGVVEDVGSDVDGFVKGDLVAAPFIFSDMSWPHCRHGSAISCPSGGNFGSGTTDGGQGEAVRVPLAGSTLVRVPGSGHSDETLKSLLTLSDVMSTGHHAAVSAGVKAGDTVAVVGDGAVGLSAVREPDQPGTGARLRHRPRRHPEGVRGDGRPHRGQVAHQSLEPVMTTWSTGDLDRIGASEELDLASRRTDGSLSTFVTMWVVRVGDDVYVRSAGGANRPWYRRARAAGNGTIKAGRRRHDVTFAAADEDAHGAIDAAYHAKYDRYGASIVGSVVGAAAHDVTIRLVPAEGGE